MAKIKRKSRQGRLAQAMFNEWMRGHGQRKGKFPKHIGAAPSIWWIMAGVALRGECLKCGNGRVTCSDGSAYCADDECDWWQGAASTD